LHSENASANDRRKVIGIYQSRDLPLSVNGIFVLAEVGGEAGEIIAAIQGEFDPKLAAIPVRPHVTIAGSSGTGPVVAGTGVAELRSALAPIAAETPRLELRFGRPQRYMHTNIVVLPLDPHGPLRVLHEKIARSGLRFEPSRFTFSPHCTLSLYPSHPEEVYRKLLSFRVDAPVVLARLAVYRTYSPAQATKLLELELGGGSVSDTGV
jgi:2'-5' RNA ligase